MRTTLTLSATPLFALSLLFACSDGDGGPTGATGGGSSTPNIAGRYTYETLATAMNCSDGTTVPLPALTDALTITQDGNRFDGVLDIASTLSAPAGASFFEDCTVVNSGAYTCSGEYRDANAVIRFSGGGQFTSTGYSGNMNLQMTLTDGTVCAWTKQERGTKIS